MATIKNPLEMIKISGAIGFSPGHTSGLNLGCGGFWVIWFIEASLIRMVHMPFSSTQFVVVLEIFVQSLLDWWIGLNNIHPHVRKKAVEDDFIANIEIAICVQVVSENLLAVNIVNSFAFNVLSKREREI